MGIRILGTGLDDEGKRLLRIQVTLVLEVLLAGLEVLPAEILDRELLLLPLLLVGRDAAAGREHEPEDQDPP